MPTGSKNAPARVILEPRSGDGIHGTRSPKIRELPLKKVVFECTNLGIEGENLGIGIKNLGIEGENLGIGGKNLGIEGEKVDFEPQKVVFECTNLGLEGKKVVFESPKYGICSSKNGIYF